MYQYDDIDQQLVEERVARFRDQTERFLAGQLSEDDFRPFRLQNGLYIQRHGPMLRVAIPYGVLSAPQLRRLAWIARTHDRGIGHFSTRQNIQYNWVKLEEVPDILAALAEVQMHATQTSGNCVRNTTTDHCAGVAADELIDPRVTCELIRQWSTGHPEFAYLPRKFKIAVNGAKRDRAAIGVHDIGLQALYDAEQGLGYRVLAGGGLGRTPLVAEIVREFLPARHLLTYLEAILRVYNRYGRRDNKYKARIKILVRAMSIERFRREVEQAWEQEKDGPATLVEEEVARIAARMVKPPYANLADEVPVAVRERIARDQDFAHWYHQNLHAHKVAGYTNVVLSLKRVGHAPGDASAEEMEAVADLSERFGFGEIRVSHEQNLVLPDVRQDHLPELYDALNALALATPNVGLLTNIIACPGGDYCALANARSLPIAAAVQARFADAERVRDVGPLDLNISGCMNACGHHHVGGIGILGVDKHGKEFYQVTLGGSQAPARLGKVIGPSLSAEEVPEALETIIELYREIRLHAGETLVETVERVGLEPFRDVVYVPHQAVANG